jgi:hypothetical protein
MLGAWLYSKLLENTGSPSVTVMHVENSEVLPKSSVAVMVSTLPIAGALGS